MFKSKFWSSRAQGDDHSRLPKFWRHRDVQAQGDARAIQVPESWCSSSWGCWFASSGVIKLKEMSIVQDVESPCLEPSWSLGRAENSIKIVDPSLWDHFIYDYCSSNLFCLRRSLLLRNFVFYLMYFGVKAQPLFYILWLRIEPDVIIIIDCVAYISSDLLLRKLNLICINSSLLKLLRKRSWK